MDALLLLQLPSLPIRPSVGTRSYAPISTGFLVGDRSQQAPAAEAPARAAPSSPSPQGTPLP